VTLRPLELRLDVAIPLYVLVVCVEFRGDWEWVLRIPFPVIVSRQWEFIPMEMRAIPIHIKVVSQFFPFSSPFPFL